MLRKTYKPLIQDLLKPKYRVRQLNVDNLELHTDLMPKFTLDERIYRFMSSFNERKSQPHVQSNANCSKTQDCSQQHPSEQQVKSLHRSRRALWARNQEEDCSSSSTGSKRSSTTVISSVAADEHEESMDTEKMPAAALKK